jgi:hypothetical protein
MSPVYIEPILTSFQISGKVLSLIVGAAYTIRSDPQSGKKEVASSPHSSAIIMAMTPNLAYRIPLQKHPSLVYPTLHVTLSTAKRMGAK